MDIYVQQLLSAASCIIAIGAVIYMNLVIIPGSKKAKKSAESNNNE